MGIRVRDRVREWDHSEFEKLTRKLQLSLIDRNVERALDQVSAFARTLDLESAGKKMLEPGDSVALLVDPESAGLLQAAGYDNIASVMHATDVELLRIRMFGKGRLAKLRAALRDQKLVAVRRGVARAAG